MPTYRTHHPRRLLCFVFVTAPRCSEWMEVLLNASGYRLKQSQIANTQQHSSALTTCTPVRCSFACTAHILTRHAHSTVQRPYEQLRALSEANRFCADCNQKGTTAEPACTMTT